MNKFLDIFNLAKLNQDDIHNLRKPMNPSELEAIIINLQTPPSSKKLPRETDG